MRRGSWQGPTIAEIAAEAGVSTATVDRVVNGRGGVAAEKAQAVLAALERRRGMAAPDAAAQPIRLGFACDSGRTFTATLVQALEQIAAADPGLSPEIFTRPTVEVDPPGFAEHVSAMLSRCDGLLLVAREHFAINRAVQAGVATGKPVVCLTTDLPGSGRTAYIGMDQERAGSTAAWLMGRLTGGRQGRIVLVASAPYRCQEEREIGFRRVLRTEFPNLSVQESINSSDDPDFAYASMREILAAGPAPLGVYNTAGGNVGIARAIAEAGLTGAVAFIGHELNENSARLLEEGGMDAVLSHDVAAELRQAIAIIRGRFTGEPAQEEAPARPVIVTKYNR
ncbi:LacI family DNA-binding transcriptional regulator [Inquilinus limosus]|uniref:LacI family DNA-binding transcriptional regulator n=1 Tax=Inquilinus limosus TaxID=171674 RepID=UPI003F14D29D